MGLLSIDREMEGLEEIIKVSERTKKKVMKFLSKGSS
jgi:hypothetical protein